MLDLDALRCHFEIKSVFVVGLISFFCLGFGDNYVKKNKDTPILSATKMFLRESTV